MSALAKVDAVRRRWQRHQLLAQLPRGAVMVEIGAWKGDFAARLLDAKHPRELHIVDPWAHRSGEGYEDSWFGQRTQEQMDEIYESVKDRFAREIESGQVTLHRLPSTTAAADFEPESLDVVYVDGDHTYEGALADLNAYWPLLAPGGCMAGDDYADIGAWWGDGVVRAVDDFVAAHACETRIFGSQFLIRRPDAKG